MDGGKGTSVRSQGNPCDRRVSTTEEDIKNRPSGALERFHL